MKVEFMSFDEATLKRFWSKVDKRGPDDCWPWLASLTTTGYGDFHMWKERRNYKASRLALIIASGINPEANILACHTCDNAICCNPNHLYWGNKQSNAKDFLNRKDGALSRLIERQKLCAERRKRLSPLDEYAAWRLLQQGTPLRTLSAFFNVSTCVMSRLRKIA